MKERISEFPERPSVTRGEALAPSPKPAPGKLKPVPGGKPKSKPRRGFFRLIVFGFVAFWLYHNGFLAHAPALITEGYDQFLKALQPLDLPLPKVLRPEPSPKPPPIKRDSQPVSTPRVTPKLTQAAKPQPIAITAGIQTVPVSIALGFRPIGFKIGAVSRALMFSTRPGSLHRRLPKFRGPSQKYGSIDLANGRRHAFVLDTDPQGYQLYVDLNRNGDLTDDGAPLPNRGKGRFSNRLKLPLGQVSGIAQLEGELELWIYSNDQSWRDDSLRFYNRTQLGGELLIKGQRYNAYLADNLRVDGDYLNDGISIDINGDGKIDRRTETFSPDDQVTLNGEKVGFNVTR